ncbi:hypothetical protein V3C99_003177, partial [Haemonchus contortus]
IQMPVIRPTIMPEDSTSQHKTVTLKLFMNRTPRITITFKDKDDLFEKLKSKAQELGIPDETVFWIYMDGEPVKLNSADTLINAANESSLLRLYACDASDDDEISCSSCDELATSRRRWKRHPGRGPRNHSRCRSRDPSRGRRSRSKDRSTSRDRTHRHHRHHPRPDHHGFDPFPRFGPFGFHMMGPPFGHCPPFPGGGHRVGGCPPFHWP